MREALRTYYRARPLHHDIIANTGSGVYALFQISWFKQLPILVSVMCPNTGVTVRL